MKGPASLAGPSSLGHRDDTSAEGVPPRGAVAIETIGNVEAKEVVPATGPRRGRITDAGTRAIVTIILVGIFATTNIAALGLVVLDQSQHWDWQPVRDIAELLLPTQGALIGSAIGFYFADSRRDS
jgi:hypothetical protein